MKIKITLDEPVEGIGIRLPTGGPDVFPSNSDEFELSITSEHYGVCVKLTDICAEVLEDALLSETKKELIDSLKKVVSDIEKMECKGEDLE